LKPILTVSLEIWFSRNQGAVRNVMMPDIKLVEKINISEKMKKGHFTLIEITSAIALGEQVILFQNRRGFSFSRMHDPGHVPHCQQMI
jgi:primosomal protein N' (replication factor Y)